MIRSIFKKYDIRGIYSQEIDQETAFKIGVGITRFLSHNLKKQKQDLEIVVGRDARLSSPILFKNLVQGINSQQAKVIDLGVVSTDLLYFALSYFKYDGGVMITASHNPKEYNGFKIFSYQTIPIYEENGLREIQELAEKAEFRPEKKKNIKKKKVLPIYVKFLSKFFKSEQIDNLKVVVDAGNGVGGAVIKELAKNFPFKLIPLYFKPKGSFPKRNPNPKEEHALEACQKKILFKKADMGLALDGDGDRTFFLNEKGEVIKSSFIIALLAQRYLLKKPGAKIVYTGNCSHIIPEVVEKYGGKSIRSVVGYPFVREIMRQNKAVLGGENSGHLFFREIFYNESPGFALLLILEILSQTKQNLSELIADFDKYFYWETNFRIQNRDKALEKLKEFFKKEQHYHEDGLTVEGKKWWFNARLSNTEPLLRLIVEAENKKIAQEKIEQIKKVLEAEPPMG